MEEVIQGLIGVLSVIVGGAFSFFKAFKFVQEGQLGLKLRFGKVVRDKNGTPKVIQPGFVLLIPFVETIQCHHIRQQTLRLGDQEIMLKDGLIFSVSAVVIFRVQDIYRALFEIDELDSSLEDLSMCVLRDVLAKKKLEEMSDMEKISVELLGDLKEKAQEWGASFLQFRLTDCAPTPSTAAVVNIKTGVKMRIEALQGAAKDLGEEIVALPSNLSAALIGVPVVAAIGSEVNKQAKKSKE